MAKLNERGSVTYLGVLVNEREPGNKPKRLGTRQGRETEEESDQDCLVPAEPDLRTRRMVSHCSCCSIVRWPKPYDLEMWLAKDFVVDALGKLRAEAKTLANYESLKVSVGMALPRRCKFFHDALSGSAPFCYTCRRHVSHSRTSGPRDAFFGLTNCPTVSVPSSLTPAFATPLEMSKITMCSSF